VTGSQKHPEDRGAGEQERALGAVQGGHARGQIGHVERAGDAVEYRDTDQEAKRGGEIDRDVMQRRPDPKRARAMQHQPVGRGEHHLEEDEEIEEVPRQEGTVHPHEQELEQAVEMLAAAVPARRGEDQRRQGEHRRQQQHQRRQSVDHQDDGEGWRPVAKQIGRDALLPRRIFGEADEIDRDDDHRETGDKADDAFCSILAALVEQHQRSGKERDQDRRDDEMFGLHWSLSLPST